MKKMFTATIFALLLSGAAHAEGASSAHSKSSDSFTKNKMEIQEGNPGAGKVGNRLGVEEEKNAQLQRFDSPQYENDRMTLQTQTEVTPEDPNDAEETAAALSPVLVFSVAGVGVVLLIMAMARRERKAMN